MYGIYNAETLARLVKTVHTLHSRQSLYESLFAGQTSTACEAYSQMHGNAVFSSMQLFNVIFVHN